MDIPAYLILMDNCSGRPVPGFSKDAKRITENEGDRRNSNRRTDCRERLQPEKAVEALMKKMKTPPAVKHPNELVKTHKGNDITRE